MIIQRKTKNGNARKVKINNSFVCPGSLYINLKSAEEAAVKLDDDCNLVNIDTSKCSICYLCKLRSPNIFLNEDFLPVYNKDKKDTNVYNVPLSVNLDFLRKLTEMHEPEGIGKWIGVLLMSFGFEETYFECAVSLDTVPLNVKDAFFVKSSGTYKKPKRVDIECFDGDNLLVFENKKGNVVDENVSGAMGQISTYASSEIYQNFPQKNKYFILSYNAGRSIGQKKIKNDLTESQYEIIKELFSRKNYHFCVVPSSELFNMVCDSLKTKKKDKNSIINLIKSSVIEL